MHHHSPWEVQDDPAEARISAPVAGSFLGAQDDSTSPPVPIFPVWQGPPSQDPNALLDITYLDVAQQEELKTQTNSLQSPVSPDRPSGNPSNVRVKP